MKKKKKIFLMGYCPFCGLGMLARRQALGARLGAQARALALGVGAGVGRLGVRAGARRAAGARAQAGADRRQQRTGAGRSGRAGARQQARQARGSRRAGRAGRAWPGSWARGLGARAGPVGCSGTRLGFQPGFSTRNFS